MVGRKCPITFTVYGGNTLVETIVSAYFGRWQDRNNLQVTHRMTQVDYCLKTVKPELDGRSIAAFRESLQKEFEILRPLSQMHTKSICV